MHRRDPAHHGHRARNLKRLAPGLLLCLAIAAAATGLEAAERFLLGRAWLDALVLAILAGAGLRSFWSPDARWLPGIAFSGKFLLELAVVLLGASLSGAAVAAAGPPLLAGIAGVVAVALAATYAIGRWLGLPRRMAALIACGNSICGNSAIAAVAPVIGAEPRDVASAIAFTAVLGLAVVLGLPLLGAAIGMTDRGYGILAGLTVYAVPQVLAATVPVSGLSAQVGTLVKLVRVLMLAPVVLIMSLLARRLRAQREKASAGEAKPVGRPPLRQLAPWFILGFLALAALRSAGAIPQPLLGPLGVAANWLTILAMAALGLGVDIRLVARAGLRISAVVTLSLLLLGALALLLITVLGAG